MPKPNRNFTKEDDALLSELGVEVEVKKTAKFSKLEERLIAGFEEIQRFVEENGHPPQHGEHQEVFERLYAVRLDRLRELTEHRELLEPMDHQGLLNVGEKGKSKISDAEMNDDELLDALGVDAEVTPIQELKHVRSRKEIRTAEEVASREKCEDFEQFKELFDQVQKDLKSGAREMVRCDNKTDVKIGDWLVLKGQTAYIANAGELFIGGEGRVDCRLRVIYSNGTESGMLRRSFQKRLWEDDAARRITSPEDLGPLFGDRVCEEDNSSGLIYVLRSKSSNPYVVENQKLIHKIGFTTGGVKSRIADAVNQPTYLLAEVEVVASYALYNLNANKLENLFHKLFSPARLDIEIEDRFGKPYRPREWFLVPLDAIKEAVDKLTDGTIENYKYDPREARLVKI